MTDQLTLLKAVSFLAGNRKLELHQIEAFQKAWDGMSPQAQAEFAATWKGKPKNPDPAKPSLSAAVAAALPLIKEFEGCSLVAYPDPETGGKPWTIGWGSTTDLLGMPFKGGDRVSQEQADDLLSRHVEWDEQLMARGIPCWGRLSINQRAALLSFTYNCGNGWFGGRGFTTLTSALLDGRFNDVPAALMLYVNPGGPSEAGLRRRRKAEGDLWSAGSNQGGNASSDPAWPGNLVGPKIRPPLKPGDHHLIANDRTEEIAAYQADGKEIWRVPCLCRGQGSDASYKGVGEDTPPGLYKVGQVYRDYDRNQNPPYSRDAMAYGWFSLDLEDIEGQESGIGRAGIMIHGGGSACGWPGAWAPRQALYPTLGCIRMHNVDLRDKVMPLLKSGQIYVSVLQEKP
jgi:GH24 family phage-related lysozyme (muramidase)